LPGCSLAVPSAAARWAVGYQTAYGLHTSTIGALAIWGILAGLA
jgi:hypothetical protein